MKAGFLLALSLAYAFSVKSQISVKVSACKNLRDETIAMIPALHQQQKMDSLRKAVQHWQESCPMNEELFRVKTLLSINEGTFSEDSYDHHILGHLLAFQTGKSQSFVPWYHSPTFYSGDSLTASFDQFTRDLAAKILLREGLTDLEMALLLHYMEYQKIWSSLAERSLPQTLIQQYYDSLVDKSLRSRDLSFTLYTGAWIPSEQRFFEQNFEFGFKAGQRSPSWVYDLGIGIFTNKSQGTYNILVSDSLNTRELPLRGFAVDLEAGRSVKFTREYQIDFRGVIGWDKYFTGQLYNLEGSSEKGSIDALTLGISTNWKFYYSLNHFVGLELKVNSPGLTLSEQTDLKFVTTHFRLIWGFSNNGKKESFLRKL